MDPACPFVDVLAKGLATGYRVGVSDDDDVAERLGGHVRELRAARGLTQQQMAKLSGLPRATWANLESGGANPTLAVLRRVALALQVSIEELLGPPRRSAKLWRKDELPSRARGPVRIRKLLPDPIPGLQIERLELPARAKMNGLPHTAGTREYLTCESGRLVLVAAGATYTLEPGDVVAFRGDQRHAYENAGDGVAVGYSAIVLAPAL